MSDERPNQNAARESASRNSASESSLGHRPVDPTSLSDCKTSQPDANTGRSVLRILDQTIDVPRVILQDTDLQQPDLDRLEPVQNPSSVEMPVRDPDSRYSLQGEIARGGMGAILKGRDVDLGRDLAIKVLLDEHKAKPEVIQRFIEEAQIGGQLQHPGIAPVYELGQFSDQRPYFSMKLVKGTTLSKLLAKRGDAAEDRARFLGIFEHVCQTAGYAHARGVIHRDLKPANIMVGAFGEVQVMDWGLAKVLPNGGVEDEKAAHSKHKQQTVLRTLRSSGSDAPGLEGPGSGSGSGSADTQMGSIMGTPAYMSPEQAQGEIELVDQRSDVFGLGAILCEILTGLQPYVDDNPNVVFRMASRGKLDDAWTRLDACGAGDELINLTKQCLSVESVDRPRDAAVLAEHITGYLESVETKLRESEVERATEAARVVEEQKRMRLEFALAGQRKRMRLAVSMAALLLLVLGLGITGASWQWLQAEAARALAVANERQANEEKQRAEQARDEATSVTNFLTDIFEGPDPFQHQFPLAGFDSAYTKHVEVKVGDLLAQAAQRLNSASAIRPEQRVTLQAVLGRTLHGTGQYDQAIATREQVLEYHLEEHGTDHHDTLTAMLELARSYGAAGRYDEALQLVQQVADLRSTQLGPGAVETLIAKRSLASAYWFVGRRNEARELMGNVLASLREVLGEDDPETLMAMSRMGLYYADLGRYDEAVKLGEQCLELRRKVLGPEHPDTLAAINNLAWTYSAAGRYEEAIELQEQSLELRRKVLGEEHPDTLVSKSYLSLLYTYAGRNSEAIAVQENVFKLLRKVLGPEHPNTLTAMGRLASLYREVGRRNEAIELQEQCLAGLRTVLGPEHPDTLEAMNGLASLYQVDERYEEAIELQEKCLELCRKVLGDEHPTTLKAIYNLAISYTYAGKQQEAIETEEELLPLKQKVLGAEHPDTLGSMTNLATSYKQAGRLGDAIELQERALEIKRRVLPPKHPFLAVAINNLAELYMKTDRDDEAIKLYEERMTLMSDDAQAFNGPAWFFATNPASDGSYPYADKAMELARKACELDPGNGMWENTLGVACYRAELWQEAIDALTDSIDHGIDVPHNWLFIALAHLQLGNQDEAKQWYDKSLAWKKEKPEEFKADTELQAFFAEAAKLMGDYEPPAEESSKDLSSEQQSEEPTTEANAEAKTVKDPPAIEAESNGTQKPSSSKPGL